jgi:hypothetical protein
MHLGRDCAAGTVDNLFHAREFAVLTLCDEHNLIARHRAQVASQVKVLAGKVLVDKKNLHTLALNPRLIIALAS